MIQRASRYSITRILKAALGGLAGLAVASGTLGLSCDSDAQAVFRQSATSQIGQGVKEFLGGNSDQAVATIAGATIDGLVDSIVQAGDGPGEEK